MNDVLAMCRDLPELRLARGECLIEEAVRTDRLYVLKSGAFEIVRGGVRVVTISAPGAFLGEISAVLGSAPTASVVATEDSAVHVRPLELGPKVEGMVVVTKGLQAGERVITEGLQKVRDGQKVNVGGPAMGGSGPNAPKHE